MYKTSQRKKLYDFLKENPHSYYTVKQIEEELRTRDASISVSAIYRNLVILVEEGVVKKSIYEREREAYYRFVDCESCRNEIHAVCTLCGCTFHINAKISEAFQNKLKEYDGFQIDKHKTVIYGICKCCKAK